ncbi:MAG: hypothetical protein V1648_02090 [Candidatus Aenigmatarchaeota archaeon]
MGISQYPVVLNDNSGMSDYFRTGDIHGIYAAKNVQLQQTKKLVGLPENPNFKPLIPPLSAETMDVLGKGSLIVLGTLAAYGVLCGVKCGYKGIKRKIQKWQQERLMNTDSMKSIIRESDMENNLRRLENREYYNR